MNRFEYYNFIERKLNELAFRIEMRGRLNLLELNLHSEDFYQYFINLLFDWDLKNLNAVQQNTPGIDLVDKKNKVVAQVSATATKQKIESALGKDLSVYKDYSFKFISISKDAEGLRTKKFKNPHGLRFLPTEDIYDIKSILAFIKNMPVNKMKDVYEFLKRELKSEPDPEKVESNLTNIIGILSKEDWNQRALSFETIPYDIEAKISYNQLDTARVIIDDYKIHYHRIEKIYSDFDKQGVNKSISILNGIRKEYLALGAEVSPDQCFFKIIEKVVQKIQGNANYTPIPEEELELCVQILVVDAFIRCKIFKNPLGNNDARS